MVTVCNCASPARLSPSLAVEPLEDVCSVSAMPASLTKHDCIVNTVSHRRIMMCKLSIARRVGYNAQGHQTHRAARQGTITERTGGGPVGRARSPPLADHVVAIITADEDLRRDELDRFAVGVLRKLLHHPAPINVELAPVMEELPSVQEITVRVQPPLDPNVLELMRMHVRAQDRRGLHVSRPIDVIL